MIFIAIIIFGVIENSYFLNSRYAIYLDIFYKYCISKLKINTFFIRFQIQPIFNNSQTLTKVFCIVLIFLFSAPIYSQDQDHNSHDSINKPDIYEQFIRKLNTEKKIKKLIRSKVNKTSDFTEINRYYFDIFYNMNYDAILAYLNGIDSDSTITKLSNFIKNNEKELLYRKKDVFKDHKQYLAANVFVPFETTTLQATSSFCDNLNFSQMDFSNWDTYCANTSGVIGVLQNVNAYTPPNRCNGRIQHSLVTSGNDPIISSIPRTFPGGNNLSVLLGDDVGINARASVIKRTFLVTQENSKLIYRYAVVLQDPNHPDNEQPFFRTRLIKPDGSYDACADYLSFAGDGMPGWNSRIISGTAYSYRNWTTVLVPLSDYIGQYITIEIAVADCHQRGHFGYAYLTFDGCSSEESIQLICQNGNYKLKAPDGGLSYLWSNGQTSQEINVSQPGINSCTILPFGAAQNCSLTYSYNYQPIQFSIVNSNSICIPTTERITGTITGGIKPYLLNYSVNGGANNQININDTAFSIPIDPNLNNLVNYSISVTQNTNTLSCAVPVNRTINLIQVQAPTGNNSQSFCNNATISDLSANGTQIEWYLSPTGGNPLSNNTNLASNTTYYAGQTINGCTSPNRLAVVVTIISLPTPTGQSIQRFCNEASISDLNTNESSVNWYITPTGGSALNTNKNLSDNTTYYASQRLNGCESPIRFPVQVSIVTVPNLNGDAKQSFCIESSPKLKDLIVNGGTPQWFSTLNNGNPINEFELLQDKTTYYGTIVDKASGCESPKRLAITPEIIKCELIVFNAVKRNASPMSDRLYIDDISNFPNNSIKIFNRYGRLVWETKEYNNTTNAFKGKANVSVLFQKEEQLPVGTYFYILNYFNFIDGKQKEKNGYLQLFNMN